MVRFRHGEQEVEVEAEPHFRVLLRGEDGIYEVSGTIWRATP